VKRDLIVVGGGAGGLVVASVAARLGLKVTLIEKNERLGGDCLHTGCVPSKTLIHSARVAALMRRGADFGLAAVEPQVDLGRVMDHVRSVIDLVQQHDDPQRFRDYGCEVLFGAAGFTGPHSVRVGDRLLQARRFVIATGSRPLLPPLEGLAQAGCLTNENIFSLRELPRRLLVLGGGAIGVEMAQAFQRLGSRVTLVERAPQLLPAEDAEVAGLLRRRLEAEGVVVHTSTRAEAVGLDGGVRRLRCSGGLELAGEALLVAVGRRPNVEGLGLEAAGVKTGPRGIEVDRRQRSSQKHIYACGDVCGPWPFTHMAEYQAGIVIANAVFRFPKKTDYRVVPRVTYTDPEVARVGLNERQARERGIDCELLRVPFSDIDRALTGAEPWGEARLLARRGRILGATLIGPQAGELIHEIVLAMQTGRRIADLSATIHAYPTLSQVHRRVVNTHYGRKLFSPRSRRLVQWLNRLLP